MIQIAHSPIFVQEYYETPESVTPSYFHYNVVGAQNNVTYTFRSLEAKILDITRDSSPYAAVTLREDITSYLTRVMALSGGAMIYLDDNNPGVDYTGAYRIISPQTVAGNTRFFIMNVDNEAPTWFGDKEFPNDYTSQAVYRYRNIFTFSVYDVTPVGSSSKNALIATIRQQMNASGTVSFSLSEVVRGYTPGTGVLAVQVDAQERDYYGNESSVETDVTNFVQAQIPSINYGEWILFNPNNGGAFLQSTGDAVLYNSDEIYPFFLNYILNDDLLGKENVSLTLQVNLYKSRNLVNTVRLALDIQVGLNSIDLSLYAVLVSALNRFAPDNIGMLIHATYESGGEFIETEFNGAQFFVAEGAGPRSKSSREHLINVRPYTLNNRRDFYFAFNNSTGGRSTYLCNQFKKQTEPEIVALRNKDNISNSVARETEYAELTFKYEDLRGLRFLFGYDLNRLTKDSGIFESANILRIGAQGDTKTWIIKSAIYEIDNSGLYKDVSFTIYRPLSSGFDTPAPVKLYAEVSDIIYSTAKINCQITPQGNVVIERGIYFGNTKVRSSQNTDKYAIILTGLILGHTYTVKAYAQTLQKEFVSTPVSFTVDIQGLVANYDGIEHGADPEQWPDLTGGPVMFLSGFDNPPTATSGFDSSGLNITGPVQRGISLRDIPATQWVGFTLVHLVDVQEASTITYIVGNQIKNIAINGSFAVIAHVSDLAAKTISLYVNGQYITQVEAAGLDMSTIQNLSIGGSISGSDEYNGKVCAMQLFDHAMSLDEIRNNYDSIKTRFGL